MLLAVRVGRENHDPYAGVGHWADTAPPAEPNGRGCSQKKQPPAGVKLLAPVGSELVRDQKPWLRSGLFSFVYVPCNCRIGPPTLLVSYSGFFRGVSFPRSVGEHPISISNGPQFKTRDITGQPPRLEKQANICYRINRRAAPRNGVKRRRMTEISLYYERNPIGAHGLASDGFAGDLSSRRNSPLAVEKVLKSLNIRPNWSEPDCGMRLEGWGVRREF